MSQDKLSPQNYASKSGGKCIQRITAKMCLPRTEAANAINWQKHINGDFDYLLEFESGWFKSKKFLKAIVLGSPIMFQYNLRKKSFANGTGKVRVVIVKLPQKLFHNKGLLCRGKDFPFLEQSFISDYGRALFSFQLPKALRSQLKRK